MVAYAAMTSVMGYVMTRTLSSQGLSLGSIAQQTQAKADE
jgi:hypothetical protein